MRAPMLLLLVLACLTTATSRYLPPLGHACRIGGPDTVDAICDPDFVLSDSQLQALQAQVWRVHREAPHFCTGSGSVPGYQLVLLLVRRLEADSISNLARSAHDAWGVGRATCQDGLVLALAMGDRELHLSTGSGVKALLTDQAAQVILQRMHAQLREGDPAGALGQAALDVLSVLQAAGGEGSVREPHRARAIAQAAAALASSEWWTSAFQVLLLCAVVGAFAYNWHLRRKEAAAAAAQARAEELLRAVQRARVAAEAAPASDDTPLSSRMTMCPICLEDYATPQPPGTVTTLPCLHKFHTNCLASWETSGGGAANRTCPMCRAPIHGGGGGAGAAGGAPSGAAGASEGGSSGGGDGGSSSSSSAGSSAWMPEFVGYAEQRRADETAFIFRRMHHYYPMHAPLFEEVRQGPATRTTFFPPPPARPAAAPWGEGGGGFGGSFGGGGGFGVGSMGGGSSFSGGGRSSKW